MGDDSIDTVILHIDMRYLATLCTGPTPKVLRQAVHAGEHRPNPGAYTRPLFGST
jgi:hypothetical protein